MNQHGIKNKEKIQSHFNYNGTFWKVRSQHYNELQWVNHGIYLNSFIKMGKFKKGDVVLDVGTGTGVVAHAIAPYVKEVIGLDKSQDMLEHSNWYGNMYFVKRNILDPIFAKGVFNKITCRQVFHHILKDRQKAMNLCYQMLKPGGLMVFSEGVPPTKRVRKNYVEIFRLKEKRVTFYPEDLKGLMSKSGFKNIKCEIVKLKEMSVRNWLSKSGLPKAIQEQIYRLHKDAPNYFKDDYNMIEKSNDCLIDMTMAIFTGKK